MRPKQTNKKGQKNQKQGRKTEHFKETIVSILEETTEMLNPLKEKENITRAYLHFSVVVAQS